MDDYEKERESGMDDPNKDEESWGSVVEYRWDFPTGKKLRISKSMLEILYANAVSGGHVDLEVENITVSKDGFVGIQFKSYGLNKSLDQVLGLPMKGARPK